MLTGIYRFSGPFSQLPLYFQISEWWCRDGRATALRNNVAKLLGKCCLLVVTPSLSLLADTGLSSSSCLHFRPVFSAKSSQLPPLFTVSLLSDSHTDFAFASMALWIHCRGMRETQREVNSSKQFGYNTHSFLVWQNPKCFCYTLLQARLSC